MNIRTLLLASSLLALALPGNGAATADKPGAKPKAAAVADPAFPLAELKPGMTAAIVQQLLGKPIEVRPMKAPEGKAEVWVYNRELGTHIEQIGFPTADIITYTIGSDGKAIEQKTPGPLRYEHIRHVIVETVELLMFNDQFVIHKSSRSERQIH